jgi:hypothetical protein
LESRLRSVLGATGKNGKSISTVDDTIFRTEGVAI